MHRFGRGDCELGRASAAFAHVELLRPSMNRIWSTKMSRGKAVLKVGASLAFLVVVTLGAKWCYERNRGIEVRVRNADSRPLLSVVVLVTGNSYPLGYIPPNSTRSVFVRPTSESGVGFSLVDSEGRMKRLGAKGYFEPGYTGTIAVDLTADSAHTVESHVNLF